MISLWPTHRETWEHRSDFFFKYLKQQCKLHPIYLYTHKRKLHNGIVAESLHETQNDLMISMIIKWQPYDLIVRSGEDCVTTKWTCRVIRSTMELSAFPPRETERERERERERKKRKGGKNQFQRIELPWEHKIWSPVAFSPQQMRNANQKASLFCVSNQAWICQSPSGLPITSLSENPHYLEINVGSKFLFSIIIKSEL